MALQIKMVKAPGGVSLSGESQTFGEQGGSLGRGDKNTWVLADPDRFLSSRHCEIICEAGRYYIVDLSTNGTFFNGSPEPMGKGSRAPLADGDTFEAGDYCFQVSLTERASPFGSPFDMPHAAPAAFDSSDPFSAPDPFTASDPFGASDPFSGGSGSPSGDLSLNAEPEVTDPLVALGSLSVSPGATRSGDHLDDLFGPPSSSSSSQNDPFAGASYSDDAGVVNQAVSWPDSSQQNLIPDDWDDDFLGGNPKPVAPDAHAKPAATFFDEPPEAPRPVVPKPAPAAPKPAPVAQEPVQTPPAPSAPVSAPQPAPKVSSTASAENWGLIEAMGLDSSKLSAEQAAEVSREVGLLMREVVEGMMQILRSRASIKNEFRMNVTTIQPVENNPLKFSADVDEALDNMFVRRSGAYKKAAAAFREGFQEVGEHQVAMIAGIRHGFESMMARFDPETLETHFNKQSKGSVIPAVQRAKYWGNYTTHYKGYVDNMESSFQHLFGSDFVDAYEAQLRSLLAARRKKSTNE